MSVYNIPDDYICLAMDSILSQTFTDFEFIIINDGSTDNCAETIKRYNDPRVRLVEHANIGLDASLNKAIKLAHGQYIARMDPDDVSMPQRFERQIHVLEEDQSIGLVGTACYVTDPALNTKFVMSHPGGDAEIKWLLLFDSPFVHGTIMARRELLLSAELYKIDPELAYVGDYALWSRLARICKFQNLLEPLLQYREHPGGMSRKTGAVHETQSVMVSAGNLSRLLNINVSLESVRCLRYLRFGTLRHELIEQSDWRQLFSLIQGVYQSFCVDLTGQDGFSPMAKLAIRRNAFSLSLNLVKSLVAAGNFGNAIRALIQTTKMYPESVTKLPGMFSLSAMSKWVRRSWQ